MTVSFIAAMSENNVIGINGKLPWNIPEDLKRFKRITSGHPCVMGRKTFDSIRRPLPNRPNIIVTRQKNYAVPGANVVDSIEHALEPYLGTEKEVFILGGGEIFTQMLPRADKIYLTLIHKEFKGDAFFPVFNKSDFNEVYREDRSDPIPYSFIDYQRKF